MRQEQLAKIFALLEANDDSFVKSESIGGSGMRPLSEDEQEFRFRVLEEDGTYGEMSLDNVFKTQVKLYGL